MVEKIVSSTLDACWRAVEVWPALKNSFERKFKSNDDLSQLAIAGIGPGDIGVKSAAVIQQQPFNVVPSKTQSLSWPIAMKVEIYKRADQYRQTMDQLEEIIRAWFGAREGTSTATVMELATCGPPKQILSFAVVFANIPQGTGEGTTLLQVCYGSAIAVFQGEFKV
jgi:hypothetical protein